MARTIHIAIDIVEHDSDAALDAADRELLQAADAASENAYAPYSNFRVGAALRLANNQVVTGNNQENIAYPSGLCAERVAIFSAAAQYPDEPVTVLAITANSTEFVVDHPVAPCGACRQVLSEYEEKQQQPMKLILRGAKGSVYVIERGSDLLPLLFNEQGLKKA